MDKSTMATMKQRAAMALKAEIGRQLSATPLAERNWYATGGSIDLTSCAVAVMKEMRRPDHIHPEQWCDMIDEALR